MRHSLDWFLFYFFNSGKVPCKEYSIHHEQKGHHNKKKHIVIINYLFFWCGDKTYPPIPKCLMWWTCASAMVPSKFKQHFWTNHYSVLNRYQLLEQNKNKQHSWLYWYIFWKSTGRYLLSSPTYHKHQIATHNSWNFVVPACKEMVKIVLGPEAAIAILKILLSADKISHWVSDIPSDTQDIIKEKTSVRSSHFRWGHWC